MTNTTVVTWGAGSAYPSDKNHDHPFFDGVIVYDLGKAGQW